GRLAVAVEGEVVEVAVEEVEVEAGARDGCVAAEERSYVGVLDTHLTAELLAEGLVRDLTHLMQEVRKRAGLAIEDSIETWLAADAELATVVKRHSGYIKDETLSNWLHVTVGANGTGEPNGYTEAIPAAKLSGHAVVVTVRRISS